MALTTGARIGPYEIVELVGAGGMGEVYRARDPHLGRDIAIKVLGPDLVGSRDAVARFEREARTASALNHPHIVHIYDVGDVETAQGPTRYIAMEFVAGETLRARLRNGALWHGLVEVLAQVADALAKAHGAGIVHRDLKPDNIMVSFDGYAKVVDFGLAKLIEGSLATTAAHGGMAGAPSRTGAIIGTVGYMSPEQAQGQPLDAQSDIFSFGCVLYEVLTGRAPFKGASSLDTLHAIVHDEPPAIDVLNPASPPELRQIAVQCLAKDPAKRRQSASDVARDLRAFSRTHLSATVTAPRPIGTRARMRPAIVWPAAAATILAAVAAGLWQRARPSAPTADATEPGIRIEKLTNRGDASNPAMSPDGRYLAYSAPVAGRQNIWLRDLAEKTETRLVGLTEQQFEGQGLSIHFGERGRFIYYSFHQVEGASVLYRIPIMGGQPRLIRTAPPTLRVGVVSPDEKHLAYLRVQGDEQLLVISDIDSGQSIEVSDVTTESALAWSRDGTRLLFTRPTDAGTVLWITDFSGANQRRVGMVQQLHGAWWNEAGTAIVCAIHVNEGDQLVSVDLATDAIKPVGSRAWGRIDRLNWLPTGSHFVVTGVTDAGARQLGIWLVSYPDGNPVQLRPGTGAYSALGVTADGTHLVAVEHDDRFDLLVASGPPAGPFKRIAGATDTSLSLCWTVDGRIIYSSNEAGSYDLYVIDADGSNRNRLTFDRLGNETQPAASRDGKYIVFVSDRSGQQGLLRINVDGTGLKSLTSPASDHRYAAPQVSPDGQWILFHRDGPQLWKMPIDGGAPTLIKGAGTAAIGDAGEFAYGASVSPDGRALAFFHASGDPRVSPTHAAITSADGRIVKRFPFKDNVSFEENERVQWSADGRAVYYPLFKDGVRNLWKQPVDGGPGIYVTQFESDLLDFDWSFDGKALAASRRGSTRDIVLISNFLR